MEPQQQQQQITIEPTREEILACQFPSWYKNFRKPCRKLNLTFRSVIIPLPNEFIDYLFSDGVRLPLCCTSQHDHDDNDNWSSSSSSSLEHNSPPIIEKPSLDEEDEQPQRSHEYSFPELTNRIQSAISDLGGSIFPKLNWSSPKDAAWIQANQSLKCTCPGDVYMLLKSSDFILHDLLYSGVPKVDYCLVLRKWCHFCPSMEFRCFVKCKVLVAISQRHPTQYFAHIVSSSHEIQSNIQSSFDTHIQSTFPLENYVFDCYIDYRNKLWVMDFNVWGTRTDSLLFAWEELLYQEELEMRVVREEKQIRMDPLSSYRAPIDTVCLASSSNAGVEHAGLDFEEFMKMCKAPSNIS